MPAHEERKHSIIQSRLWSYAFLFMGVELADAMTIAVDSVFGKMLGPVALAARGMASPIFMLCSIFSGVLAVGMRSRCSASMSAGNDSMTQQFFSTGCAIGAVFASLLTLFCTVFRGFLVQLCGANGSDPILWQHLYDFLHGFSYGIPGYIAFFLLSPIVTLDGNKKCVSIASAVMLAENVIMDYLAVTVLPNGIFFIGLASGISYVCASLVLLTNFLRKRTAFHFSFKAIRPALLPEMLHLGAPKLTRYGCKLLAPLIVNNIVISVGGSSAMAALSMQSSIMALCAVPGMGVSNSVNLFSEVYYSERDKKALFEVARSALRLELLTCIPVSLLAMVFADSISAFYLGSDPVACQYGITALFSMSMAVLLSAVNTTILSYLQGARMLVPTHLQTISHKLLGQTLSTLILSRSMGVNGLFYAIPAGEGIVLAVYLCMCAFTTGRDNPLESFLLLPEGFCQKESLLFGFTITSLEEAVNISDEISQFCRSNGIDARRSMFASLCAEEMVTNVVKHGFRKDTKPHSCDIRVMIEDGDVVLRIRDDCRYFNLKERYDTIRTTESDISAHVGIRLVYKIAKDIRYVNLLDTNTLLIRI